MISVCIATYNGDKFLKQQLESILIQIDINDEIIISDDSSTDKTLEIIEEFELKYKNIKCFKNKKFHSPIFNFENAIKHAKGDYIFLCDQDDIWLNHKVSTMLKYLDKYDLVVSDCKVVDKDLNILYESFFKNNSSGKGFLKNLAINTYLGCCMAFKKNICEYILPFPSNIAMHDIWIGLCVEINGKTCFIKDKLSLYRRHGDNASSSSEKSKYPISYRIKYRITMFYSVIYRSLSYKLKIR